MALFVFLLQNRFFLKQTRFLRVAITEWLLMYQSPNVYILCELVASDFHRRKGPSYNAVTAAI